MTPYKCCSLELRRPQSLNTAVLLVTRPAYYNSSSASTELALFSPHRRQTSPAHLEAAVVWYFFQLRGYIVRAICSPLLLSGPIGGAFSKCSRRLRLD